jgi:putative transposase
MKASESESLYSYLVFIITMNYKLDKGAHSFYTLQYHFIQVVKYRRKIFTNNNIIDFLKQKIREISETFDVEILDLECDKDHFHMIFKAKPTLEIPKYINAIKTITSREIQRNFPYVKKELWKGILWSSSYFLATTGQVTLDVLKRYVESQGKQYE